MITENQKQFLQDGIQVGEEGMKESKTFYKLSQHLQPVHPVVMKYIVGMVTKAILENVLKEIDNHE